MNRREILRSIPRTSLLAIAFASLTGRADGTSPELKKGKRARVYCGEVIRNRHIHVLEGEGTIFANCDLYNTRITCERVEDLWVHSCCLCEGSTIDFGRVTTATELYQANAARHNNA